MCIYGNGDTQGGDGKVKERGCGRRGWRGYEREGGREVRTDRVGDRGGENNRGEGEGRWKGWAGLESSGCSNPHWQ